ncbi:prepilin-type N-terminal cleavage/methylation domain-containing protein [Patescibacteria group bacterium]|nr:prepilin-type N-terminal cleavage/methylation domain-containing protein [Patescibacteria group bacterium]
MYFSILHSHKVKQKAFTLVEVMVVVGIIMIIATMSFGSSYVMKYQIEFRNASQSVSAMLSNARNMALSGQSYIDTGDFDQDGSIDDQVLPNGYIVNIGADTIPVTIELYADLQVVNGINTLDGSDVLIESIDLPEDIFVSFLATNTVGDSVTLDPSETVSFLYSTPNADFSIIDDANTIPDISVQVQLSQQDNEGDVMRDQYIYMNYMYGTPEVMNDSYIN